MKQRQNQHQVYASNFGYQGKKIYTDMDFLDAYKLTIGKTFLYGSYENFVSDIGIPNKVTIIKKKFVISSKPELDKVVGTAKDPNIVTLHYPGIDMWYTYNNSIVPSTIDFRKTDKSLNYGETKFDKSYSFEQFRNQFPKSSKPSFVMPQSFFEIATKEKGANFKHYMLQRKSKDDSNATPLIEFTFDNGSLIFILFANFG